MMIALLRPLMPPGLVHCPSITVVAVWTCCSVFISLGETWSASSFYLELNRRGGCFQFLYNIRQRFRESLMIILMICVSNSWI